MKNFVSRREFLAGSAYAAGGLALGLQTSCLPEQSKSGKPRLQKALILNKPTEELLTKVRDAGFDGVEAGIVSQAEAVKARKTAEKLGLRIHSVLRGWAKFNSDKPDEVQQSLAVTVDALAAGQGYGADAILLVPGRIGGMAMPQPWEFQIEFDEKNGHLTAVAKKDNDRYRDYIAAHNHAYDSFRTAITKLIPQAEKTGVVIAVENVWNNLFADPRHARHFIDSFKSQSVHCYFDIGNHLKYSRPEEWIGVLGKRIAKCHVKDFRLNANGHGGRFVNIRDGSVDWPAVRKALAGIGYNGWMTIEGSGNISMAQRNERLDLIIAGT